MGSGAITLIIDLCLKICNTENPQNSMVDEKLVAMEFLVDIWRLKPEIIQSSSSKGKEAEIIIAILKRAARNWKSKVTCISAINLLFVLLDSFTNERNMYAPIIYKTLTFILVDFFQQMDHKEEILRNFLKLFQKHPSLPIQILAEPYLKQILINLEK